MSLHFNDYEEISEKNAFFGLKFKYCYEKLLKPGVSAILESYFCVITLKMLFELFAK